MKEGIQLTGREPSFRRQRSNNSFFILLLLLLIVASLFLLKGVVFTGEIKSPFQATLTPTRTSSSFALEGETQFNAGNLDAAIAAYKEATKYDPTNPQIWSELARIQTYSSASLTTDADRRERLQQALDSINTGLKSNPDNSLIHAVRAFVLDWNANPVLAGDRSQSMLNDAEQEAIRALQIDKNNTLAMVFYAEVLVDQQNWTQAQVYIQQALDRNEKLMDLYRVNAYVQESLGNYNAAIKNYQLASEITPNLTFLYIYTGYNYRQLRQYDTAVIYFAKAVNIDKQLQVKDPVPYIAIGKTLAQKPEADFINAARNVRAALSLDPKNADIYGNLGVIYFKARNYEGAIPALQCAVSGCDAATSCNVRTVDNCTDPNNPAIVIKGLDLSTTSVVYYYTYASVLAGMDRPGQRYCADAVPVMKKIRQAFANDKTILSIIVPSEEICANAGYR